MNNFKDGLYEGIANGYYDLVKVKVLIKDSKINKIDYQHNDTKDVGGLAIQYLVNQIIEKQTTQIPYVAGARFSSAGILSSVEKALKVASGDITPEDAMVIGSEAMQDKEHSVNNNYFEKVSMKDNIEKISMKGGTVSKEQIISILLTLPEKIYVYDQHGKLQFFNKMGENPEEINKVGKNIIDFLPEKDQAEAIDQFSTAKKDGKSQVILNDGASKKTLDVLYDENQNIIGYLQTEF